MFCKNTAGYIPDAFVVLKEKDEYGDEYISLLIRDQFKLLATDLSQNQSRAQKRIIIGPPGCGKSTTLYQTIHFCLELDWIVFHIIKCDDLCCEKQEEVCRKILEYQLELNPSFEIVYISNRINRMNLTFKQFILDGIFNNRCEETLQVVIAELCQFKEKRVLFAFDRWNILLNNDTNTIANRIASWFTFDVSNGFALFCTSSSFTTYSNANKKYFPESSAQNKGTFIKLSPYNKDELDKIINLIKSKFLVSDSSRLSNNLDDLNYIIELTGCVPRHVKELIEYIKDPSPAKNNIKEYFTRNYLHYYEGKIKKLIDKCEKIDQVKNLEFLSQYICNYSPDQPTEDFINEGLFFEEDNGVFRPLSNIVWNAAIRYLSSKEFPNWLVALANDPQINWRAFELFLLRAFICQNQTLLDYIVIDKLNIYKEEKNSPKASTISPNTLIVCNKDQKVCDFVIYTQNKELLIIKISKSVYDQQHKIKRMDLFKKYNVNEETISIIQHYCNLTRNSIKPHKNWTRQAFCKNKIFYVYITCNKSTMEDENLIYVLDRNYLKTLTGWDKLENYFCCEY